jgi:hypothetical protein
VLLIGAVLHVRRFRDSSDRPRARFLLRGASGKVTRCEVRGLRVKEAARLGLLRSGAAIVVHGPFLGAGRQFRVQRIEAA